MSNYCRVLIIEKNLLELEQYSEWAKDLVGRGGGVDGMDQIPSFFDNKKAGFNFYRLVLVSEEYSGKILLEHFRRVKSATSVVVFSGQATVEKAVEFIQLGAQDYLTKPVSEGAFRRAVRRALDKKDMISACYVDDGTGLYNTRYLDYVLDQEMVQAEVNRESFAVLFIDADCFKEINDEYGHLVGTALLRELGGQLRKYVREKDTVFRYGGDEFVVVLSSCDLYTAMTVAERVRESVAGRFYLINEGYKIKMTISIGVALFPQNSKTKDGVIEAADQAMYQAKKLDRNRVVVSRECLQIKKIREYGRLQAK